jgi:hypothetical protein
VRPFDELMADLEDPLNVVVWSSRYATQLERWLSVFDADRVLVIENDELRRQRAAVLRRVFAFLDVDPDFSDPSFEVVHNRAPEGPLPTALGRRLPAALARRPRLRPHLLRDVSAPEPTAAQRERLVALLRPEKERLRALTGLSLDNWTI